MNNKAIIRTLAVIMALVMLLSLVFSILPASVFADNTTLSTLQAQNAALEQKTDEAEEKITKLQKRSPRFWSRCRL